MLDRIIREIFERIMDIYDKFKKEEEIHPFLREDNRPLQFTGRPRKD